MGLDAEKLGGKGKGATGEATGDESLKAGGRAIRPELFFCTSYAGVVEG